VGRRGARGDFHEGLWLRVGRKWMGRQLVDVNFGDSNNGFLNGDDLTIMTRALKDAEASVRIMNIMVILESPLPTALLLNQ